MDMDHFLYFAYGSNLLSTRLMAAKRCPSALSLGLASLASRRLKWHKPSKKDGSTKCDIVPAAMESIVHGVLYQIPSAERPALDREEGLGKGYDALTVSVLHNRNMVQAVTYCATLTDPMLKPWSWYRALVIAGAKEHGLPAPYVKALSEVAAGIDPDEKRHNENMALIPEAYR